MVTVVVALGLAYGVYRYSFGFIFAEDYPCPTKNWPPGYCIGGLGQGFFALKHGVVAGVVAFGLMVFRLGGQPRTKAQTLFRVAGSTVIALLVCFHVGNYAFELVHISRYPCPEWDQPGETCFPGNPKATQIALTQAGIVFVGALLVAYFWRIYDFCAPKIRKPAARLYESACRALG